MNKPTTVNESPNMQLEYQRLVYNDKHSTFSNKDKDDAQRTKSKAKVVSSKTTQDLKRRRKHTITTHPIALNGKTMAIHNHHLEGIPSLISRQQEVIQQRRPRM